MGSSFRLSTIWRKCDPSRASLLTGLYHGNKQAVNIASLLNSAGYTTLHAGKEHFDGWVPDRCYASNVFDQSFTFWANNEYFIPPDSTFAHPYFLNGQELTNEEMIAEVPEFYKTDLLTHYAIKFLDEANKKEAPFFLYMPFNAAHYPLQAKPEDIAKYQGVYHAGWDKIRKERYERMIRMGLIDQNYPLSAPSNNINKFRGHPKGDEEIRNKIPLYRPWEELSDQEKQDLELEMTVFAAIVDCMDQNIGKVLAWLKDHNKFDNTLIMYLSDNGSCPYDSNKDFDHPPGPADSFRCLAAAWANVGNTPFRYFKQFGHEGGCNTQFIVHWPDQIKPAGLITQPGTIVDIFPTLLDIAGLEHPETFSDLPTLALDGHSLYPIFKGEKREEPNYFLSGYTKKFRMFRSGNWKIVRANNSNWELYNLLNDRTETKNLADSLPGKLIEIRNELDSIVPKSDQH